MASAAPGSSPTDGTSAAATAAAAGGLHDAERLPSGAAQAAPSAHVCADPASSIFVDDFDSGADTEMEEGSQVTVVSDAE